MLLLDFVDGLLGLPVMLERIQANREPEATNFIVRLRITARIVLASLYLVE